MSTETDKIVDKLSYLLKLCPVIIRLFIGIY